MHEPTLAWLKKRRIAVLYGGWSEEKVISRITGKAVLQTFLGLGLKAYGVEVECDLPAALRKVKAGFAFLALHGRYGEDGTVQGLCEIMNIPYSGSGVLASALSMNKAAAKHLVRAAGVSTPESFLVTPGQSDLKAVPIKMPFVVKPADGGSAIGVTIVRRSSDWPRALRAARKVSSLLIVEKFISGTEVTASILSIFT